jgi:asparagine synthase (glutamine-hydrolysing)
MCGICGIVGFDTPHAEKLVRTMNARMTQRGPDDEGVFAGRSAAVGMRRLSIIDLTGGHQPVFNEDGSIAVVCNGEIYNFRELRRTLESHGHRFRTNSDTEAIVHAYEQWGDDCVQHLEGMFAFAALDKRPGRERLLIARDRLGIKPLYYAEMDGALLFASEVRALLASGLVEPQLSPAALESYLLFGSVVEPLTMIEGVYSLPPAHRIAIDLTRRVPAVVPERYWSFAEASQRGNSEARSRSSVVANVRALLEQAVDSHLIADVPLGIFLSSGIDSTALVALAARKKSQLHTVSVVFPEQEFSEGAMAARTAKRFSSRHQELKLSGNEMLLRMHEAVGSLDQPSMDGINSYFVSWGARQAGLKVALSGLGGDELFGGYSTFRNTAKARRVMTLAQQFPASMRSLVAPERIATSSATQKLSAMWRSPDELPHPYFYTRLLFTPEQVSALLGEDATARPWMEPLSRLADQAKTLDEFNAVSLLESQSYMANTLLRDTDCMSMAHSLEVRVPFLHHPLVEFVAGLPGEWKRSNGTPKPLLVDALRDLLPAEVVAQRKRTFTLPWEHWLHGPLKEEVGAELNDLSPALQECVADEQARQVWTTFLDRKTSWSRVWSLFVLSRWSREHVSGAVLTAAPTKTARFEGVILSAATAQIS